MDYIESEMHKRRAGGISDSAEMIQQRIKDPADELFHVAEKYRRLQEEGQKLVPSKRNTTPSDEGNSTLSAAMLSTVPEIDLGMRYVSS